MTGYELYLKALTKLGESGENLQSEGKVPAVAVNAVNDIGADLFDGFHTDNMFEEISIENNAVPAFTYGIAMLLADIYGKSEKSAFFTELYNMKRAAVKSSVSRVKNSIPAV